MGSSLISIGVAVNQNRSIISDIDDLNKNSKSEFHEDFLLESPTIKHRSADQEIKFNQKLLSYKSAKIGKIAKFREKAKDEQQDQPVIFTSMVSQLSSNFFHTTHFVINETISPCDFVTC